MSGNFQRRKIAENTVLCALFGLNQGNMIFLILNQIIFWEYAVSHIKKTLHT